MLTFAWGIPAIAGLAELSRDDAPPLVTGVWIIALALSFFAVVILVQLLLYLGVLYWLPHRRVLAIVLSPVAVGVLFVFARASLETLVVVIAGLSYGASMWFPQGPPAWWENRPRRLAGVAAAWLAAVIAVGIVQPLPDGVRTDVTVRVRDGSRVAGYRLACEYDRAGRVRAAADVANAHPGGDKACELLDDVAGDRDSRPLQRGCAAGGRSGEFRGTVRDRPFHDRITAVSCEETAFVDGETSVLVPPLGG